MERDFTFAAAPVLKVFHGHLNSAPPLWDIKQNVTPKAIQSALDRGQFEATPWDIATYVRYMTTAERRRWHAGRVAYLVKNGWEGGVEVEVERNGLGWPLIIIQNGCHRLRAAAFRGDPTIDIHVRGNMWLFDRITGLRVCAVPERWWRGSLEAA